jgi:hypothetical protein
MDILAVFRSTFQSENSNLKFGKKYLNLGNKMSWLKKILHFFTPLSSVELPNPFKERVETVRARNTKGRYVADDPSTPDVNEAYKNVPKKKRGRPRKKK